MKGKLSSFIFIIISFFIINSCSEDNRKGEEVILSLSKNKITSPPEGGIYKVGISTNQTEWSFTVKENWIKLFKEKDSLVIDVQKNKSSGERKSSISIKAGNLKKNIEVFQNKAKQEVFQIYIPDKSSFESSLIQNVLNTNNEKIGEFCLEYIKDSKIANQMITFYFTKDNATNITFGYTFPDGGIIKWNKENNTCTYEKGSAKSSKFYLTKDGEISFTAPNDKEIKEVLLQPFLIKDTRGDITNNYKVVKIGTQYWMAENLNAQYYIDGTLITTGLTRDEWLENKEGAFTYYENNPENAKTMGALYNWYAVKNLKGLAPKGYRISSNSDWAKMAKYLDPKNYGKDQEYGARESETIAPLLKSTTGWNSDGSGNNLSGLNVYPYGSTSKSKYMEYSGKGRQAYFWTTNEFEANTAFFRRLYYDEVFTNRWFEDKTYGYSVRCVRID